MRLEATEEPSDKLKQRLRLRPERSRQRTDRLARDEPVRKLHLIPHGRTVLILKRRAERHRRRIRRNQRNKLTRTREQLLNPVKNVIDLLLRRAELDTLSEDRIHEVRPARSHPVRQIVDLTDDIVRQHQAVQCFLHFMIRSFRNRIGFVLGILFPLCIYIIAQLISFVKRFI